MDMYVSWRNKPKVTYYLHWAIIDALTRNIQDVAVLVSQGQLAAANHVLELLQSRGLGAGVQLRVRHQVEADLNAPGPGPQVLNIGVLGVEKIGQLLAESGFKSLLVGFNHGVIVGVYPKKSVKMENIKDNLLNQCYVKVMVLFCTGLLAICMSGALPSVRNTAMKPGTEQSQLADTVLSGAKLRLVVLQGPAVQADSTKT